MAKKYKLKYEQIIEQPIEKVFDFFSRAENLERITPHWLKFKIITPIPIKMQVGTLIDYKLKIKGFPVKWRTAITNWDPPYEFNDEQLKGPYRSWVHRHHFVKLSENETKVIDTIEYSVWGGSFINWLLVSRDVQSIFKFRKVALDALLNPYPPMTSPLPWK